MITTTTHQTETLNDLIRINYDRIEGYRKAAEESKEIDISLHPIFQKMADESRLNVSALTGHIKSLGTKAESGSTTMGTLYRAWMSVKATFSGNSRKSILASCEYGEDQAQKAYEDALNTENYMDTETRELISVQKEVLKKSHDQIKAMRDAANN